MLGSRASARGAMCALAGFVSFAPLRVLADVPAEKTATVVQVDKDDLFVDLGALRGATEGDVVEIWRPIRIRHPVTGQVISDRFLIGKLRLVQVRPQLSLARAEGTPSYPPQAGDVVIAHPPQATSQPPVAPPVLAASSPAPSGVAIDEDERLLSALFDSLTGSDLPTRIRAYENFTATHTRSRHAAVLWEEARSLRRLLSAAPPRPVASQGPTAEVQPIDRVIEGEPLRIAVTVHGAVNGAVLHERTAGDVTYRSQPMQRSGEEYWAATIPADRVRGPALEWFVEAVADDGAHPVVGDPATPASSRVESVQPAPTRVLVGTAQVWTDYAAFDTKGDDYTWQTEGVLGTRLGDVGIRAVRTGFGVYRGVGGTLQALAAGQSQEVGLTYGYLEGEFGITPIFSLIARAVVGLQEGGVDGGASGFVRIGSDRSTNLLLGGEILGGIGLRGIAELDWAPWRRWPIVLRSEVTNQPAGLDGDVGVRVIGQAGYEIAPRFVVSARGSYQGRTITHAGPGGGAAVGYTW